MNTGNLIEALRQVPECRLRLIDLVREIVREDGFLDLEKAAFYHKEIEEAIGQAEEYARATKEAVQCLREMAH